MTTTIRCPSCDDILTEPMRKPEWWGVSYCGVLCASEAAAAMFHDDTGMLAPGKDEAAAVNSGVTMEQRRAVWDAWLERKRAEFAQKEPAAGASKGTP